MSSNKSKRYSAEFKAEAIKRAREVGAHKVCQELGVSNSTIYKWLAQVGAEKISDNPEQNPFKLAEEIKQLKKENARLKEEREILKKATEFFAKLEK